MTITRRIAAAGIAAMMAEALAAKAFAADQSSLAGQEAGHDMSNMPASWMGHEQIAFLVYPQFTALDMVGPHYMLTNLMGAKTQLVAKNLDLVKSDAGLMFKPDADFESCPADLDIICVPGGTSGTLAAMQDEATLRFLADRGSRARFVTSVCTGSLVLGAAGLLNGYKATSHWLTTSVLAGFGATYSPGRIVQDRNRITGGGVTAGIDFGLTLVGQLRDRQYAEAVQLLAEYAPQPPYDAGTPDHAPAEVTKMMQDMMAGFVKDAKDIVSRSGVPAAR